MNGASLGANSGPKSQSFKYSNELIENTKKEQRLQQYQSAGSAPPTNTETHQQLR
jgi:hypothetical protein